MIRGFCSPLDTLLNPLKLAPAYRDFWGDQNSRFVEKTDPICDAACYVPRVFHAPDNKTELAGVPSRGYLEFILPIPAGSFILGFLHNTARKNVNNFAGPPADSGFSCQITDVRRDFKFFSRPVPETYFLNDATAPTDFGVFAGGNPYVQCPAPRLLPAPYPITPPGELLIEFWNQQPAANNLIQLSLLVAVPAEAGY